jgi:hypothetical protein
MFRNRIIIAGAVFLLAACQDDATAPDAPQPAPSFAMAQASQDPAPDPLAVAQAVPGFGGYFIDHGVPTVWLTDPSQRALAEQALAGFLADRGWSAADLVVRQAAYTWLQLDAWHNAAWPHALSVMGAVYTDIDESSNRLRFGGLNAQAVATITAAVAATGVPAAAVVVQETAPIRQVATLRDRVRPVPGGYQLNFFASPVSPLTYLCTLGFNVVKDGVNSFITNSHCTNVQGGIETPTDYYQPTRGLTPLADNFIAVEVEDPHYDAASCLTEMLLPAVCRWSDASRAAYAPGQPFALGRIARTVAPDTEIGTLDVDARNSTFRITGEQNGGVVGDVVHKVGRTTGWTYGEVVETCINSIVLGTVPPIVQRCQDRVRAGVDGGDSGSPVFRRQGNGPNVRLVGLLWGSSATGDVKTFVFSPMTGVRRELGDFRTH